MGEKGIEAQGSGGATDLAGTSVHQLVRPQSGALDAVTGMAAMPGATTGPGLGAPGIPIPGGAPGIPIPGGGLGNPNPAPGGGSGASSGGSASGNGLGEQGSA